MAWWADLTIFSARYWVLIDGVSQTIQLGKISVNAGALEQASVSKNATRERLVCSLNDTLAACRLAQAGQQFCKCTASCIFQLLICQTFQLDDWFSSGNWKPSQKFQSQLLGRLSWAFPEGWCQLWSSRNAELLFLLVVVVPAPLLAMSAVRWCSWEYRTPATAHWRGRAYCASIAFSIVT